MRLSEFSIRAASSESSPHFKTYRSSRAAFLVVGACVVLNSFAPAQASVLSRLRNAIGSLWGERSEKRGSASHARAQAAGINRQKAAIYDRLEDTQRALLQATEVHQNFSRQLDVTERKLVQTRREVRVANKRYNAHRKLLGRRLASMQRTGRLSYVQLMLSARSLNDLARRAYYFNAVARRDAELQAQLKQDRQELQRMQNLLMAEWAQRARLARAVNRERMRVASAAYSQQATLRELNSNRYALLAYAEAQEQSAREIEDLIGSLSARRSAIASQSRPFHSSRANSARSTRQMRRVAREMRSAPLGPGGSLRPMPIREIAYYDTMRPLGSGNDSLRESVQTAPHASHSHDGGGFCLPVRGRLSSRFGMRYHPILRRRKLHTGADVAARQGTPFRAAREGKVLFSGWKKAYGNTVIVDHGDGVATLYGHASKLNVRAGQPVKAGQHIGNVGSTGWSTGPHLHFEVHKNGKPVNPKSYLRGR
ncbi:MAG TPA: peptidoglycan DD-metalloendopeptidase family protein [Abditibacteriaceae bacterium]|jgi:murein DD-endopeptidase MepM/ murein hydrolase activator NlpD